MLGSFHVDFDEIHGTVNEIGHRSGLVVDAEEEGRDLAAVPVQVSASFMGRTRIIKQLHPAARVGERDLKDRAMLEAVRRGRPHRVSVNARDRLEADHLSGWSYDAG